MKKQIIGYILASCWAFLTPSFLAAQGATACANRTPISTPCTCNGTLVSSGYCCYYKVYPSNQKNIVAQSEMCGYTEVSPHYPSLKANAHGNIYFAGGSQIKNNPPGATLPYPDPNNTNVCALPGYCPKPQVWAKQYDVIFNGEFDATAKLINPNLQFMTYQTGNEIDCVLETGYACEKYNYFQQRAAQDGIDFESLFLHLKQGVTINGKDGPRTFSGCPNLSTATAQQKFMCRVPFGYDEYWRNNSSSPYYPQDWRWKANTKNPKYHQYLSEWYVQSLQNAAAQGEIYDGIFVDNMGRSPYGACATRGTYDELESGQVWELTPATRTPPGCPAQTNLSNDWYNGMQTTLAAVSQAVSGIGKKIYINSGTAEFYYSSFADVVNGGPVREWFIKAKTTNSSAQNRFLNDALPQAIHTKGLNLGHYLNFTMETSSYENGSACLGGYTLNKEKMWSLATYYLLKYDNLYFYPGWKTWDADDNADTFDGYLFGAMKTDIGDPIGDPADVQTPWKTGLLDSAGRSYKIYRRNYTKGAIFVRFHDQEGFCPGANATASSVVPLDASDLTADYRMVNVDGSTGTTPVTSISLGIADGIILKRASGGGVPPAPTATADVVAPGVPLNVTVN